MKNIKLITLIASIASTLITAYFSEGGHFSSMVFIPIFYGILFCNLVPNNFTLGPGIITMLFFLFIRYIITTPIFAYEGFPIHKLYSIDIIQTAMIIYYLEILVIILCLHFSKNRDIKESSISDTTVGYFVPLILAMLSCLIIITTPSIFDNMYFILNTNGIIAEKTTFDSHIGSKIIDWANFFVVIYIVSRLYAKKKSPWLIFIIAILPCLFYDGHSRLSIVIPLLTLMYAFFKLYPSDKRKIGLIFIGIAIFSFSSLTLVKTFKKYDVDVPLETVDYSSILNAYAGGITNTVSGVSMYEKVLPYQHSFIDDLFMNFMGLTFLSDKSKTAAFLFNREFYADVSNNTQIIPTTSQGLLYFGYPLFWITTVIMVLLVLYFDRKYKQTKSLELTWLYAMMAINIAIMVPGSFQHMIAYVEQLFLPLIILIYLNSITKRKFL